MVIAKRDVSQDTCFQKGSKGRAESPRESSSPALGLLQRFYDLLAGVRRDNPREVETRQEVALSDAIEGHHRRCGKNTRARIFSCPYLGHKQRKGNIKL